MAEKWKQKVFSLWFTIATDNDQIIMITRMAVVYSILWDSLIFCLFYFLLLKRTKIKFIPLREMFSHWFPPFLCVCVCNWNECLFTVALFSFENFEWAIKSTKFFSGICNTNECVWYSETKRERLWNYFDYCFDVICANNFPHSLLANLRNQNFVIIIMNNTILFAYLYWKIKFKNKIMK